MKRASPLKHLHANGCVLLREGRKHSIYLNPTARKVSSVPRHREVDEHLARKICLDLGLPNP
ncbi:MAG: type II toxin-antitoxin system HicA family toxin [Candidatus Coatesbacteria bacterium]